MGRKLTTKDFVSRAEKVHGETYDYSLVEYTNSKTKVKIVCNEHGIFEQTPEKHVNYNNGCPNCSRTKKMTNDEFISKAIGVHGEKYKYGKTKYETAKDKVIITCNTHGDFEQTPSSHISQKTGCPKCSEKHNYSTEEFTKKARSLHNNKYGYHKTNYVNNYTKVIITCNIHGDFEQTPSNHLKGKGCQICKESKGENIISLWLDKHDIKYEPQHKFDDCIYERKLPFDFYLPELNTCIEFQGKQHYEPIEFFGGEEGFVKQKSRDKVKEVYCENNDIRLIKIKYNQDVNKVLRQL